MPTVKEVLTRFSIPRPSRHTPLPIEIPGYDRKDLATWFGEWGLHRGVEVGVFSGQYSAVLLRRNPSLHLYSIDPFLPYGEYTPTLLADARKKMEARLHPYRARSTFICKTSEEAAGLFPPSSLGFVYIDGDHDLLPVIQDLYTWIPKIRPGGIVAGHDYVQRRRWPDIKVVQALHAYTQAFSISPWFVVGEHRKAEVGGRGDFCRSWFWVV